MCLKKKKQGDLIFFKCCIFFSGIFKTYLSQFQSKSNFMTQLSMYMSFKVGQEFSHDTATTQPQKSTLSM